MNFSERWTAAWSAIGLVPPASATADSMLARYREPHRAYHTDQHLAECFSWLDETRGLATDPVELELVLWYHDAVYQPKRSDNEQVSAHLATADLRAAGAADELMERVTTRILLTAHADTTTDSDAQLLLDIDLAILGAPSARYAEYADQVRAEYQWVPTIVFRPRRREILERFLKRHRLYQTPFFHDRLEASARINLRWEIGRL